MLNTNLSEQATRNTLNNFNRDFGPTTFILSQASALKEMDKDKDRD